MSRKALVERSSIYGEKSLEKCSHCDGVLIHDDGKRHSCDGEDGKTGYGRTVETGEASLVFSGFESKYSKRVDGL